MVSVVLSLVTVLAILLFAELLWNKKLLKDELGRKFVHIAVGTFVAFWPLYMSLNDIRLIAMAFLFVVVLAKYFGIFKAIHSIDRASWGEAMFAIGIGLAAVLAKNELIFSAAILHLSLADGLAGVVGKSAKRNIKYKVLGYDKSLAGTLSFVLVSMLIVSYVMLSNQIPFGLALAYVAILPLGAAGAENIGVHGLDNIFVPIIVSVAFNQLSLVL